MVGVPLGRGAYKRQYTGAPEIQLVNRWLESNPANMKEQVSLISRPGTRPHSQYNPGGFSGFGSMRGNYTLEGLFFDSLFIVCGDTLYRLNSPLNGSTSFPILGVISGTGHPEVTWQRGSDYQRLWISDGILLQFYSGGSQAQGTLEKTGTIVNNVDIFELAGTYYTFGTNLANGTGVLLDPFVVDPLTDPLRQLIKAINGTGIPGTDYSTALGGPNNWARAQEIDSTVPAVEITIKSQANNASGNSVTTTVIAGTGLTAPQAHLSGGGVHALQGCTIPDGQTPSSVAQVDGYVLVSIAGSQKFYWINPGETVIDPLNFASKESGPDPIVQMRTVGDQVLIMGSKTTENWYATGDANFPFAPVQGRTYARGSLQGSAVVIDDDVFIAGDDGKVYQVGLQGINSVSNNGIEERIRKQTRKEWGLEP